MEQEANKEENTTNRSSWCDFQLKEKSSWWIEVSVCRRSNFARIQRICNRPMVRFNWFLNYTAARYMRYGQSKSSFFCQVSRRIAIIYLYVWSLHEFEVERIAVTSYSEIASLALANTTTTTSSSSSHGSNSWTSRNHLSYSLSRDSDWTSRAQNPKHFQWAVDFQNICYILARKRYFKLINWAWHACIAAECREPRSDFNYVCTVEALCSKEWICPWQPSGIN